MVQTSATIPRMVQTVSPIPGAAVRGVASGVLAMAFFGTLWAGIGIGGLQSWLWLSLVALLVGIGLLSGGSALIHASRRLANPVSAAAQRWKQKRIWFGIIFATEGVSMGVVSSICGAINRFDLIFPLILLIVGVHFFPLAALFQVKIHYLVGALLCLLALMTLLVVPERATLGDHQIILQLAVLGFGAAVILWGVGLWLWLLGKRMLAPSEPPGAHMRGNAPL